MLTTPKATAFRHPMSVVRFVATLIGRRPARDARKGRGAAASECSLL